MKEYRELKEEDLYVGQVVYKMVFFVTNIGIIIDIEKSKYKTWNGITVDYWYKIKWNNKNYFGLGNRFLREELLADYHFFVLK